MGFPIINLNVFLLDVNLDRIHIKLTGMTELYYIFHSVHFGANPSSDVTDMIETLSYRILETFGSFCHQEKPATVVRSTQPHRCEVD